MWEETHNMGWANALSRRGSAKSLERMLASRRRRQVGLAICMVAFVAFGVHLSEGRRPDHSAISEVWVFVAVLAAALVINHLLIRRLRLRLGRQGAGEPYGNGLGKANGLGEAALEAVKARRCPRCGEALHFAAVCPRCGLSEGRCTGGHPMPLNWTRCAECNAWFAEAQDHPPRALG